MRHFKFRYTSKLQVGEKKWKKVHHINRNQKRATMAKLVSNKIHLKIKIVNKIKKGVF